MSDSYERMIPVFKSYVKEKKHSHCVIGVSGGVDSTVGLLVSCEVFGGKNVTPVFMPYKYTNPARKPFLADLCRKLGTTLLTMPLNGLIEEYTRFINQTFYNIIYGANERELQTEIRAMTLNKVRRSKFALLFSTLNKTELMIGNFHNAELTGDVLPFGDMYKTEMYGILKHYSKLEPGSFDLGYFEDNNPDSELDIDMCDEKLLGMTYKEIDELLSCALEAFKPSVALEKIEKLKERGMMDALKTVDEKIKMNSIRRKMAPPILGVTR